jgi:hypothetical protein
MFPQLQREGPVFLTFCSLSIFPLVPILFPHRVSSQKPRDNTENSGRFRSGLGNKPVTGLPWLRYTLTMNAHVHGAVRGDEVSVGNYRESTFKKGWAFHIDGCTA